MAILPPQASCVFLYEFGNGETINWASSCRILLSFAELNLFQVAVWFSQLVTLYIPHSTASDHWLPPARLASTVRLGFSSWLRQSHDDSRNGRLSSSLSFWMRMFARKKKKPPFCDRQSAEDEFETEVTRHLLTGFFAYNLKQKSKRDSEIRFAWKFGRSPFLVSTIDKQWHFNHRITSWQNTNKWQVAKPWLSSGALLFERKMIYSIQDSLGMLLIDLDFHQNHMALTSVSTALSSFINNVVITWC